MKPERTSRGIGIRPLLRVLLAIAVLALLPLAASAAERVALVIGNSTYNFAGTLKNPRNDAEALAAALNRLGFRVIKGIDADRFTMQTLVRAFATEVESAKIGVFFYAGHGLQLNGKNYLVPVDAKLEREVDLDFEAMDTNFVLRQMERGDRVNIVLLDACRNNPLSEKLARSLGERSTFLGRGLARIETGVGTLVGFSTQPGNIAVDGEGDHSPFAIALLDHIETPGLDVDVLMRRVREQVIAATGGRQVPWSNSSLVGDKVVLRSDDKAVEPVIAEPPPKVEDKPQFVPDNQIEITFWNSVRDSRNRALLDAYLEKFPGGNFTSLARAMIEELEAEQSSRLKASEKPQIPLPRDKPQVRLQPDDDQAPETVEEAPALQTDTEEAPAEQEAAPPLKKEVVEPPAAKKKKVVQPPPPPKKEKRPQKVVTDSKIKESPQACGFCYECAAEACRQRRWTCGARYRMRLEAGLCNRNR